MSTDRFSLDLDPESLTTAIRRLTASAETLTATARRARSTRTSVQPRWRGESGVSVMTEMSALATSVDDAVAALDEGARALRTLRREYRAALETVPDLNRRWREAEQAHADAVSDAEKTHRADLKGNDDPDARAAADRAKEGSRDIADFARGRTQQVILADFVALEEEVAEHTRTAGRSLHTTAWAPWTEWVAARGLPSWMNGFTPFDLDDFVRTQTLKDLALAKDISRFERDAAAPRSDWQENLTLFDGLDVPAGYSYDVERAAVLHGRLDDLLRENDHLDTASRAALVRRWTDGLSPADLVDLTLADPERVGNLGGFPEPYRYGANRLRLLDEEEKFEQLLIEERERVAELEEKLRNSGDPLSGMSLVGAPNQRLERLEARLRTIRRLTAKEISYAAGDHELTHPPQVLVYEPARLEHRTFEVLEETHVAVVYGDLEAAKNVSTVVGGMTTSFETFTSQMTRAQRLMGLGGDIATIAWMEHEPPPVGMDWDMLDAVSPARAEAGGDELVEFSAELDIDAKKHFFGHSYGGTTLARALRKGLDADTATFLGAPGPGRDVDSVSDLKSPGTKLYAAAAPWDPVTITSGQGRNLVNMAGVTELPTNRNGRGISGHVSYFDTDTDMLDILREIGAGEAPDIGPWGRHVPTPPSYPKPTPHPVEPRPTPSPAPRAPASPQPGPRPTPKAMPSPTP